MAPSPLALLLLLLPAGVAAVWPEQQALDCKLREFAHEFSMAIRPSSDAKVVADGLELGSLCKQQLTPAADLQHQVQARVESPLTLGKCTPPTFLPLKRVTLALHLGTAAML